MNGLPSQRMLDLFGLIVLPDGSIVPKPKEHSAPKPKSDLGRATITTI